MVSRTWMIWATLLAASGCAMNRCQDPSACRTCQPKRCCWPFCIYPNFCDGVVSRDTARHCAIRALKQLSEHGESPLTCDYRDGFIAAYVNLAQGAKCVVPAAPPPKYWTAYYRSAEGQQRVEQWFEGYQQGLELAQNDVASWSRVLLSVSDVPNRNRPREMQADDGVTDSDPAALPQSNSAGPSGNPVMGDGYAPQHYPNGTHGLPPQSPVPQSGPYSSGPPMNSQPYPAPQSPYGQPTGMMAVPQGNEFPGMRPGPVSGWGYGGQTSAAPSNSMNTPYGSSDPRTLDPRFSVIQRMSYQTSTPNPFPAERPQEAPAWTAPTHDPAVRSGTNERPLQFNSGQPAASEEALPPPAIIPVPRSRPTWKFGNWTGGRKS